MTKDQIKAKARELYALADRCCVPMLRACRRISMATSTPHRWLHNGSAPGEGQMDSLRAAILRIAHKADTLPEKHHGEFAALGDEPPQLHRPPGEIARELARGIAELQDSIASNGG